ncbi:(2Fe-2S)-binding protein [Bosea caraganae]|uniref:(2Fe-2S)-binding protein n=1 Tax=Bosea caraganae TaxID=2763117 RepID=A0A370KY59_9HYPH|nr:Rieske 2Fe-2S domain-containing protein [Bosea caraganae]RDJ19911.1 (2Fe-2S)-binding protein [Bosea caraganae]RDJ23849.1 (2Fe-2S)-binding protein [Bosea caraganae]
MISAQDSELLTRVGPGAALGELMRQYWIPACLSSELESDGAPVRIMLLGEKLIAFRDSEGRVGLMDHRCPHRCASLFFGRNEEGGIRCAYHGWKFGADGQCLDMPNVPPDYEFSPRVKVTAYPTKEMGGLVWTYMGKREKAPPPPAIEVLSLPLEDLQIRCHMRECNWLQSLEGDIDTSHFGFLHVGTVDADDVDEDNMHRWGLLDRAPMYKVKDTDWGTMYAAYRPADAGQLYYRFAHFMFPCFAMPPDGNIEDMIQTTLNVPMDDEHTMVYNLAWKRRTPSMRKLKDGSPIPGASVNLNYMPRTDDWFGRWRLVARKDNDYQINREMQQNDVSYTGIEGVGVQDQAMVESMGPIVDRTLEHLAPSDRMISATRRRIIAAARAFQSDGSLPATVENPEVTRRARGGSIIADERIDWLDVYAQGLGNAKSPANFLSSAAE